jgi:FixJ family two-component response regulator
MASSPLPRPSPPPIVYVLDDEPEMVKALTRLLRTQRFEVLGFTSVRAFLELCRPEGTACLVLDVAMPELDGLELQRRLTHQGILIPIVFLTGHGDIPMSVRAIKAGATDFLTKPVDAAALVQAVRGALQVAETRRKTTAEISALADRLASLTLRQREVMERIVAGQLNKQIAYDLGTGEQNIKLHRAHVMRKMGVESLADLVRAAERLGVGKSMTSGKWPVASEESSVKRS